MVLKLSIEGIVERVIEKYPEKVLEFKAGVRSSFDFLVKEALKMSGGKADPAKVRAIILAKT